ncbi:uncharacterized protein LOC141977184 isoform X2 [Natator depressus]|uniref:uncharacterized protein LOC141977184 isoform X2 n=1 Tax=Natator depressus TaxID=27790 RepID=UPI003EB8B35E
MEARTVTMKIQETPSAPPHRTRPARLSASTQRAKGRGSCAPASRCSTPCKDASRPPARCSASSPSTLTPACPSTRWGATSVWGRTWSACYRRHRRCTQEQTDRHVQKNTSRDLYARMASPHTSLQEKGAIVRDFHQATLGIFGSVGGPVVAVLLRNASLSERLEAALQEAEASPVLRLPMDALRRSSEEIARAVSACAAPGGPAGETAAGPPENGPFSGTGVVQSLGDYLPDALTGRCARNALAAAAGHLEEALRALAPACKSFQLAAAAAEVYVALITEQQPGTGEGLGQNPPGVAH